MKVYTLVITECQGSNVNLLNVIMKTDPAEIATIIEDDYNDMVRDEAPEDENGLNGFDEEDLISVKPEEIVNDASWTHDCENAGDLFISYHVLVQNLEVTNDKVELTNPEV